MTGWRIGYAAANEDLIRKMTIIQEHTLTCVCSFGQKAALAALKGPRDTVKGFITKCDEGRKLIVDELNKLPNVSCQMPRGTFYAFVNITNHNMSSNQFSDFLLEKAGVMTVPGPAFGVFGEGYVRFSFALPKEHIKKGLERIKNVM